MIQHDTAPHRIAPHCITRTTRHYITQHRTALHDMTPHDKTRHDTALQDRAPHRIAPHCITRHDTALHNTAPHYTTWHRTTRQDTTLHYTTGHRTALHDMTPCDTTRHDRLGKGRAGQDKMTRNTRQDNTKWCHTWMFQIIWTRLLPRLGVQPSWLVWWPERHKWMKYHGEDWTSIESSGYKCISLFVRVPVFTGITFKNPAKVRGCTINSGLAFKATDTNSAPYAPSAKLAKNWV